MELDFGSEGRVSKGDFLLDLTALAESPKIKKREAKVLAVVAVFFWKRFAKHFTMSERVLFDKLSSVLRIKTR
jgi:hypothetical protein